MTLPRASSLAARPAPAAERTLGVHHDAPAAPGGHDGEVARNPGVPLDLDHVLALRVNRSAVERRAATIPTRRTVKKEWQAAWLLRALTCIDLTTLSATTPRGTCAAVRQGAPPGAPRPARGARDGRPRAHGGRGVRLPHVGAHGGGGARRLGDPGGGGVHRLPAGLSPLEQRVAEIRASVAAGAREIDIVITRAHVLTGDWQALYDEVSCSARRAATRT
jgi:deoxyribose-phosphate aldolase